ncbi:hypothetical protein PWKp16_00227 [Klebsiella phage PWKp16]|nr:hypothetical protein PWKp16_00227 [Klebsiella phage PWKp16]
MFFGRRSTAVRPLTQPDVIIAITQPAAIHTIKSKLANAKPRAVNITGLL